MAHWLELEGKTVIVTGGSSGIGKAIAAHLNQVGARVVVADLNTPTMSRKLFDISRQTLPIGRQLKPWLMR